MQQGLWGLWDQKLAIWDHIYQEETRIITTAEPTCADGLTSEYAEAMEAARRDLVPRLPGIASGLRMCKAGLDTMLPELVEFRRRYNATTDDAYERGCRLGDDVLEALMTNTAYDEIASILHDIEIAIGECEI